MVDESKAERLLRSLMGVLVLWDLGLAVFAIGFPHHLQEMGRFEYQQEPLWVRGVGVYWGFAAWFQLLAWRNPRRYLTAVQLAVLFRLSAAAIDLSEVAFLLPRPMFAFHYVLLFFVAANIVLAVTTIVLLKRMGLPWVEFHE